MNEIELVEAFFLTRASLEDSFIVISTLVFAYIAMSHFAGKDIGPKIAVILSGLYSFIMFVEIIERFGDLARRQRISLEYIEKFPDGVVIDGTPPLTLMYIVSNAPFLFAWVVSIYYLHYIVRKRIGSRDDDT